MRFMTEQVERGYRVLARPLVSVFKTLGLSPNSVTLLGLGLGIGVGFLIYSGKLWSALIVYFLMMVLDHVDGQLARATGRSSAFGAFFDGVTDRMRIPIFILAITAHLYGGSGEVRWLYVGFVVNSLILLNALIGLQGKSIEPGGEEKQQVREKQGYDRGLRKIAVAVMNFDMVDWLNNSVLLILFLALGRLDLYMWTSLVCGVYAILMKIARQYMLHGLLQRSSRSG